MAFTAQDVKNLREQTGCGMMDCKKALTESNGDFDKAVEFLSEKGLAAAAKKAGRIAAEGMVYAVSDVARKLGVVVEVNAETDFVAKNAQFVELVNETAKVIAEGKPANNDEAMALTMANGSTLAEAYVKLKVWCMRFPMSPVSWVLSLKLTLKRTSLQRTICLKGSLKT